MNKVIAVNLNGIAYQLEETGYDRLRDYLEAASGALAGNPDHDEILADIEQAIGDKFRATLEPHRTVVATRDVERIISDMGPVAGAATQPPPGSPETAFPPPNTTPSSSPPGPRRLYLIREGAMIGGVCNGLAAYTGIDVSIVRVVFALFTVFWGLGLIAYAVLYFVVPRAETPEQKATAQGLPNTAQEFIRRAREGYYQGMKTWGDRQARREWKRKFRREMRGWGRQFQADVQGAAASAAGPWEMRGARWGAPAGRGAAIALPILGLAHAVAILVFVLALIFLIRDHALFGIQLPSDLPLGIALLIFLVLFHFATFPLRAAKYACVCGPGFPRRYRSGMDRLAGWVLFGIFLWWANRHVPAVHAVLVQIPLIIRETANTAADWLRLHLH